MKENTSERNWLIRTSQNQILGPVAKAKVLEFLEKGALGLNDEVASGNGYWFSLKEKDLVEKYLYGDVPQGYNPISESKSVLSRRDNPDKTTSLNTAPANKTQVMKTGSLTPGVLPQTDDLEYPDLTMVNNNLGEQLKAANAAIAPVSAPLAPVAPVVSAVVNTEEAKIPNQDDLEFPDMTLIASSIKNNPHTPVHEDRPLEMKSRPAEVAETGQSLEPVVYPDGDDLDYPDMESMLSASNEDIHNQEEEEDRDFIVGEIPKKKPAPEPSIKVLDEIDTPGQTVVEKPVLKKKESRDFKNEFEDGSGLSLEARALQEQKVQKAEPAPAIITKEMVREAHLDDKKLLHERKVKASLKEASAPEVLKEQAREQSKEHSKDQPKEISERVMPEHLKKRNDNYLMYVLVILVLIILSLFFYYYRNILNKPLPV